MDPALRVEKLIGKWQAAGALSRPLDVYACAVAEKWRQVLYTLNRIRGLDTTGPVVYAGTTGTAGSPEGILDTEAEIRYFCDALWTCLHSTLDILAQLVNVVTGSALTERDVDFSQVVNHLNQSRPGTILQRRLDALKNKSRAYQYLTDFRNCATHRRAVYIERLGLQAHGTPGYTTATADMSVIQRVICDDPLTLNATVSKRRELSPFCKRIVDQIGDRVDSVLLAL